MLKDVRNGVGAEGVVEGDGAHATAEDGQRGDAPLGAVRRVDADVGALLLAHREETYKQARLPKRNIPQARGVVHRLEVVEKVLSM